uniref:Uncharacterized protein n=1 Tax=Anguilla anguilla TaxID=7936 RepID=A0A0E9WD77_ANGAN
MHIFHIYLGSALSKMFYRKIMLHLINHGFKIFCN